MCVSERDIHSSRARLVMRSSPVRRSGSILISVPGSSPTSSSGALLLLCLGRGMAAARALLLVRIRRTAG